MIEDIRERLKKNGIHPVTTFSDAATDPVDIPKEVALMLKVFVTEWLQLKSSDAIIMTCFIQFWPYCFTGCHSRSFLSQLLLPTSSKP